MEKAATLEAPVSPPLVLPGRMSRRRRIRLIQEVIILGFGYLVYSQVRGMAGDRVNDGFANAQHIISIEKSLGIFEELAIQTFFLPHDLAIHVFNIVYFYGFFPLVIPCAFYLFLKKPQIYVMARNAFLSSGFIAVILFLTLPTAPPRLLDVGFVDTLSRSLTPTYDNIPGVNEYAALPSMHVGWNFLTAIVLYLAMGDRRRWRAAIFVLPVIMLFATVVTGNHWLLDGMLGVVVAGGGLLFALLVDRHVTSPRSGPQAPSSS